MEKAIEDSSQTFHKSKDAWFEVAMAVAHMSKIMYCGSEKPIDFDALSRVKCIMLLVSLRVGHNADWPKSMSKNRTFE